MERHFGELGAGSRVPLVEMMVVRPGMRPRRIRRPYLCRWVAETRMQEALEQVAHLQEDRVP